MSSAQQLYQDIWQHLKDLFDWKVMANCETLAAMMVAVFYSQDVRLSEIADQVPLPGKQESMVQRMRRFLKNPRLDEAAIFQPVVRDLLAKTQAREGLIRLQMDRVQLGNRFNVLMVTLGFERRALPLAWEVLPHQGNSDVEQQRAVLKTVQGLLPPDARVHVLADREFGHVGTMRLIADEMGWDYVLRVKSDQQIVMADSGTPLTWHTVGDLVPADGDQVAVFESVKYTKSELYETHLVMRQAPDGSGDHTDDPWIVATSLSPDASVLEEYAHRFGCEPLFSDLKERGFRWEKTRLRHADRVSRFILVLALLTTWLVQLGYALFEQGIAVTYWQPSHLERYSLFQIGMRWLRKQLTMGRLPDFESLWFGQVAPG